jgi:hypothetical protein
MAGGKVPVAPGGIIYSGETNMNLKGSHPNDENHLYTGEI